MRVAQVYLSRFLGSSSGRWVDEAAYRDQYGFGEKIVWDGRE